MKSTATSDRLFLMAVKTAEYTWDHTVNINVNVFHSTFKNIFILVTFLRFLTLFKILPSTFLARDSIYAIARYMPSPVRLSVRPAVRHTGGSVKDGYS